jgi:hypothetical protein
MCLCLGNIGLLVAAYGIYIICLNLTNYFIVLPTIFIIALGVVAFIIANRKTKNKL